ncbi:hypothetical protein [Hymenobacter ruber]
MEDQFKRLVGQVARALNIPAETVADYAESDEAIKGLSKAFKDNRETLDTAGYQRAEGKIKQDVEKALKTRGVEAPSFDKLSEGLDQLETVAASRSGNTLTEDQARENPIVKKLLTDAHNEKLLAVAQAGKDAETALEAKRTAFLKEQEDAQLETQARRYITEELNPNLNTDPAKAKKQVDRMVAEILAHPRKKEADGSFAPIDASGKLLDNGAGGSKSFTEFMRDVVTTDFGFDLPEAKKRDHVPNGTPAPGTPGKFEFKEYKGAPPTTEAEVLAIRADQRLPLAQRQEVKAYWEGRNPTT